MFVGSTDQGATHKGGWSSEIYVFNFYYIVINIFVTVTIGEINNFTVCHFLCNVCIFNFLKFNLFYLAMSSEKMQNIFFQFFFEGATILAVYHLK